MHDGGARIGMEVLWTVGGSGVDGAAQGIDCGEDDCEWLVSVR